VSGWWRRNRLWLPALPVALAVMVGASAYNVPSFIYDAGPHDELASADQGEYAEFTDEFTDAYGDTSRTLRVRLSGVEEVAQFPYYDDEGPREPPDGLTAVQVHLDWEAEPDQVVSGCTVQLEDEDGRRYGLLSGIDSDQPGACVPDDAGGPAAPVTKDSERGQIPSYEDPRPTTWSTDPIFLVPDGRDFTTVLVYWQLPRYAALSVS
jgi:hypothetical protein